jgi:hypothetical protein
MTEITKEYKEHEISINDLNMRHFKVTGPLVEGIFYEYDKATAKIDDATAAHEAQSRKRISVVVLDERGDKQTITGIHASTGRVLGLKTERFGNAGFYPDVEWVGKTLREIVEHEKTISMLRQTIGTFRMTALSDYGREGKLPHAVKVDRLAELIEAKTREAQAKEPSHSREKIA